MKFSSALKLACAAVAALALNSVAAAQDTPVIKRVRVLIGSAVGAAPDLHARLLTSHLSKYLPGNPEIVAQNVDGGSGVKMMQYFMTQPVGEDVYLAMVPSGLPFRARAGGLEDIFDPRKLNWIGSYSDSTNACALANSVTLDDLKASETTMGSTTKGSNAAAIYAMLNRGVGYKIKAVAGYKGTPNVALAVAQGEIQGMCSSLSGIKQSQPVLEGKARMVLYMGPRRRDDLTVPYLLDLDVAAEQKSFLSAALASISMGRPYALRPDIDPALVPVFREALRAAVEDPGFQKDAAAVGVDLRYQTGEQVGDQIGVMYDTPDAVVKEINTVLYGE